MNKIKLTTLLAFLIFGYQVTLAQSEPTIEETFEFITEVIQQSKYATGVENIDYDNFSFTLVRRTPVWREHIYIKLNDIQEISEKKDCYDFWIFFSKPVRGYIVSNSNGTRYQESNVLVKVQGDDGKRMQVVFGRSETDNKNCGRFSKALNHFVKLKDKKNSFFDD